MSKLIQDGLNPAQREAIYYGDGPMLVLAGAGSGKTKVLTHRFTSLASKYPANSILTMTFTNKAAEEMKTRICKITKKDLRGSWVGTFHSQCNKILRREIEAIGYKSDFTILDDDDQAALIKHILKEFKMYEALHRGIQSRISFLKSAFVGPEEYVSKGDVFGFEDKLSRLYIKYQTELKKCNALDFDDLILLTIKLFEEHPKVLKKYQAIFQHLLVDEFQDTNLAQYKLLKTIASHHKNICVVGDDDQSIYSFRGADHNNIMNFEKDFPGAKVVKLEQNYRSTQNILDVAGGLINQNSNRHPKKLFTDKKCGEKISLCWFGSDLDESKYIAKAIKELYLKGIYNYSDVSILYRVNLQSRVVEDALRDERLPYRVIGGISFYQRKEVKDLVAYMRLGVNPTNSVSLRRIINCPPRGIGASTIAKMELMAKNKGITLFAALKELIKTPAVTATIKEKLEEFVKIIEDTSAGKFKSAADMFRFIYDRTKYSEHAEEDRIDHIMELIASAEGVDVKEYLDKMALMSNSDEIIAENVISLMTLHAAKGLEFPVVFITGLEEGVLPYFKAKEASEIAEERRLLYVGMTRAKELLCLSGAKKRRLYTKIQEQLPSRFIKEMPTECCLKVEKIIAQAHFRPVEDKPKTFKAFLYSVGSRVKHPTWGVGVVRDCSGEGEDQKIVVNFSTVGVKKLALKFIQLERM